MKYYTVEELRQLEDNIRNLTETIESSIDIALHSIATGEKPQEQPHLTPDLLEAYFGAVCSMKECVELFDELYNIVYKPQNQPYNQF